MVTTIKLKKKGGDSRTNHTPCSPLSTQFFQNQ
ncbi:hypothetical protein A2U01_0064256, partial [Trifolium medium]|nr:hypothetical protein [Trifolium medium]